MIKTHILKKIVATEKALKRAEVYDAEEGSEQVVVFQVDTKATKPEIRRVIEAVYNVQIKSINTLNQIGKAKIFKQRKGTRSDYKKAYVTLQKGSKISVEIFGQEDKNA